jgi:hypothetical protein
LLGEVVASDVRNEATLRSVGPRDQHMGIAMANHPMEAAYRKMPRIFQFRLWTIFVGMAAVAVLAALAKLFGNDGLFLGSIGVPLITGLVLIRGPLGRKLALSVAGTFIVHGITWCVISPDAKFWRTPYRGDDVLGVSLSLGLIAGGVIILALRRRGLAIACLTVALFWSLLLNVVTVHNIMGLRAELIRQWGMGGMRSPPSPGSVSPAVIAKPERTAQVINGTFEEWAGDIPVGWTLGIGATTGSQEPKSTVRKADGPALMLQGDASTQAWQIVTQSFPVDPQTCYRVAYEARTSGLKRREEHQFDNCYVGVFVRNVAGDILSRHISTVSEAEWSQHAVVFRPSVEATQAEAAIFLSKTGTLCVKSVRLEQLTPQDSFQVLVEDMDRHYPFFSLKRIDWEGLTQRYRVEAEATKDAQAFSRVLADMLSQLKDIHIWIDSPAGRLPTYRSSYEANSDQTALRQKLRDVREFGTLGFVGGTEEGYGVIVVNSLSAEESATETFLAAIEELFDAPAMVIDLRDNSGGSELLAARIAAMFADKRRMYAASLSRSGRKHDDLDQTGARFIEPMKGTTYLRPVVCLVGPGCVSSGEALAQMMKTLPHATLVGQPTRGASGNPAPVNLPNGISVWYSRWVDMLPDGTPIEGKGVPPDITVEHESPGDPTFDAAVKILDEKTGQRLKAEEAK